MSKVRDYRIDALKGFLILSVVFGHFFTHDASHGLLSRTMANFIYSYHMPLFVFISGFFSGSQSNFWKGELRILETYLVFQLIKGLWLHYSFLKLLTWPAPMLWYLFALFFWRLLLAGMSRIGMKVSWQFILLLVLVSVLAGFVPWIGRRFALNRFLFFAPYFFLGVLLQRIRIIDEINKRMSVRNSIILLIVALLVSALLACFSVKGIISIFAGVDPYPERKQYIYMAARLFSYVTSFVVSLAFIRLFSVRNGFIETIGRESLKYYMFHGICLMLIEAMGVPWSSFLAIVYAVVVSLVLYCFNKTGLSDFVINPVTYSFDKLKVSQI